MLPLYSLHSHRPTCARMVFSIICLIKDGRTNDGKESVSVSQSSSLANNSFSLILSLFFYLIKDIIEGRIYTG